MLPPPAWHGTSTMACCVATLALAAWHMDGVAVGRGGGRDFEAIPGGAEGRAGGAALLTTVL